MVKTGAPAPWGQYYRAGRRRDYKPEAALWSLMAPTRAFEATRWVRLVTKVTCKGAYESPYNPGKASPKAASA